MQTAKIAVLAASVAALALVLAVAASSQPSKRRPGLHGPGRPSPAQRGGPRNRRPGIPPGSSSAKVTIPIYDVHVHFFGGSKNDQFAGAVAAAVKLMDRYGVRKAVVMSPPRGQAGKGNYDYPQFIRYTKRHPGRLAFMGGGGSLNPLMHSLPEPAQVTDKIKKQFADRALAILKAGAVGFGEMSSLHLSVIPRHGYNFVPADHPLLLLLADIAAEHDVPIDLHMDTLIKSIATPAAFSRNQNPKTLPETLAAFRRLLEHNPKAKIVWAHGGSDHLGDMTAELVGRLMDRYPNLYMSLRPVPAWAPRENKLFAPKRIKPGWAAVFNRHPDRFVIGNDCVFVSASVKKGGALLQFSKDNEKRFRSTHLFLSLLSPDLAKKFAYENAARLYKLGGP